ncbi:MAG: von Willebrand factor type A domain-containing protein [Deltaproteobacteria bacterium]|nr:von Willebrand factor type A domain-containing protein [Deltaproteobacteria bacterium]MDQ3296202.1 von Willebrand factor type A domain-containing protein [Myxococcota bacterium]
MSPSSVAAEAGSTIAAEPGTTPGDTHVSYGVNPWVETSRDNLSTFAADVDTASYTYARRSLLGGALPPAASVRVEEFVNAFKYSFPRPAPGSPFSVVIDAAPSPLVPGHHILRVGVATPPKAAADRKPANLVFLVDVSGSMNSPDKIGLAKQALTYLLANLRESDTVSLVTYAGATQVVLPATSVEKKREILAAIQRLQVGGSTAMGSGLDLAYDQAMKSMRPGPKWRGLDSLPSPGSISRVIVLSDGDANVGPTSQQQILDIIDSRVKAGVTLSTIGFGMGNYRADLMEQLGDRGNGNNYYIDSQAAAHKLFSTDLVSVLEVAAKDAKLQVEFDPTLVARYRLIGYENRDIKDDDFRKDRVDAGEIGVGHQVTAMYEVQLTSAAAVARAPLATVRIRHKAPDGQVASENTFAMASAPAAAFDLASADFKFAYAVASFADLLRGAEDAQGWSLGHMEAVARATAENDADRLELVTLIGKARELRGNPTTVAR